MLIDYQYFLAFQTSLHIFNFPSLKKQKNYFIFFFIEHQVKGVLF